MSHDCAEHTVTSGEGTSFCARCEEEARAACSCSKHRWDPRCPSHGRDAPQTLLAPPDPSYDPATAEIPF